MKLVDDARQAWRWFSVQAMGIAFALQGTWAFVPDDLKQNVPKWLVTSITMTLLVCGVVGRLIKQEKKDV